MSRRWTIKEALAYQGQRAGPQPQRPPAHLSDGMNKWERAYYIERLRDLMLSRQAHVYIGAMKLRLGVRTYFTPDFLVVFPKTGIHEFHEVKGQRREDAMVKLKTAASLYPSYRFILATGGPGKWSVAPVAAATMRGI